MEVCSTMLFYLLLIILGSIGFAQSLSVKASQGMYDPLGGFLFPAMLSLLIMGLSGFFLIRGLKERAEQKSRRIFPASIIVLLIDFTVYLLLVRQIGYLLSTFLMVTISAMLFFQPGKNTRKLLLSGFLGFLVSSTLYLLFGVILNIPLP